MVVTYLGIGILFFSSMFAIAYRRVRRHFSTWIVRQLRRSGSPLMVEVKPAERTWNPGDPKQQLFGPGRATYTLDDDDVVHLRWQPVQGSEHIWVGPVPALPSPKIRSQVRLVVGLYTTLLWDSRDATPLGVRWPRCRDDLSVDHGLVDQRGEIRHEPQHKKPIGKALVLCSTAKPWGRPQPALTGSPRDR